ncbi:hypothetical protein IE81DRAFT_232100 [Ceraceosorus guamensis]|uniref:Uncharacterized protein n=1 Tax=Ceraceosorus guamensis TaxID=1522189 RepID=A0A316VRY6_9BASI|nr:hypothetical protein IE81DRAFT_232100 [Ceraceosorus guamensis]PWN40366.1 hypothetical protein IE81DRAFT_232100 [Ceraceosorus guamensis]
MMIAGTLSAAQSWCRGVPLTKLSSTAWLLRMFPPDGNVFSQLDSLHRDWVPYAQMRGLSGVRQRFRVSASRVHKVSTDASSLLLAYAHASLTDLRDYQGTTTSRTLTEALCAACQTASSRMVGSATQTQSPLPSDSALAVKFTSSSRQGYTAWLGDSASRRAARLAYEVRIMRSGIKATPFRVENGLSKQDTHDFLSSLILIGGSARVKLIASIQSAYISKQPHSHTLALYSV